MKTTTKKSCSLFDAAEQVERMNPKNNWEQLVITARVSYSTGWSIAAIEGEIDRQYHAWCAGHGYDYT